MIDADGLEALSMRKLGQALNRDPMRLYSHAESKAALVDAVAEMVLSAFIIPTVSDDDWGEALRSAAVCFRTIALAHPQMVPLLITRPLIIPVAAAAPSNIRCFDGLLVLLTNAGFDEVGALRAYRFFAGFLAGHVLQELQETGNKSVDSGSPLRLGLQSLSRIQFPRSTFEPPLVAYNGAVELAVGMDIVLLGLRSQLDAISHARKLPK